MLPSQEQLIFATRATSIITAACRRAHRPVVLLPALYCAEVASALETAGLKYRCYDVAADLSTGAADINRAFDSDIGSIIILHPFGLSRTPLELREFNKTLIIEDACHALRTAYGNTSIGSIGDVTVYSLRKEFGWLEGGIASGPLASALMKSLTPACHVEQLWQAFDKTESVHTGRMATKLAVQMLAERLPPVMEDEVLTALPIKSSRRDTVIASLRAKGILAWRWIGQLKQTGPRRTPQAWMLRRQLLLVPLPVVSPALELMLEVLDKEPLEPWSSAVL